MRHFLTLILTLTASLAATAQSLTLEECLRYARSNAPANVVAHHDSELARYDARLAMSSILPTLSFSGSGNMSFGRNIDPETNTYDNKKTLSSSLNLGLSLPLFDGLVSINKLRAARAARRRQLSAEQRQADEVSLSVVRAFYEVSYCRAMVEQMAEQLRADSTSLVSTLRGVELGVKSRADAAEMEALVATDRYELTNQRGLLAKAFLALRGAMGMELTDEPLDIVDTETPRPAADPAWSHPRVAEATEALAESRHRLRAARGLFSPRLSLSAGISTSYYKMIGSEVKAPDFSRQWHDNMGQYIGLSLSIPIFDGLSRYNGVRRAAVEVSRSRALLSQARYETEREEAEARLALTSAIDEHIAAQARYEAEQTAYTAARRRYELGAASAIDLYTASAKFAAARALLEGKRIQAIVDRIIVDYYRGVPFLDN